MKGRMYCEYSGRADSNENMPDVPNEWPIKPISAAYEKTILIKETEKIKPFAILSPLPVAARMYSTMAGMSYRLTSSTE